MGKTDTFSTVHSTAKIISFSGSYFYPKFKIWFISYFRSFQFMSFPPSCILRTYNGLLSSFLDLLNWQCRVRPLQMSGLDSRSSLNFFEVFFQLQFWRWYTDSFFNRLGLFILLRRLCSLFFSLSALQNMIHFIYFNSSFLKLNKNVRKCHKSIPICNGIALTYK